MPKTQTDHDCDRLEQLLDVALDQLRNGDGESSVLALQEALVTAKRLPTKETPVICLPDLSGSGLIRRSP